MNKSPLYTTHPSHTSHSSWHLFTHVKGRNTHVLDVESRRHPYGPHPHTKQHIKVSTLSKTHSSNSSKQIVSYQLRMSFKSGFGVVSVCALVSRHTDTNESRILPSSQTPVICNLTRESSRVSLLSNKMWTRVLYTPPILHTLHTRPDISSHMSRVGTLTY